MSQSSRNDRRNAPKHPSQADRAIGKSIRLVKLIERIPDRDGQEEFLRHVIGGADVLREDIIKRWPALAQKPRPVQGTRPGKPAAKPQPEAPKAESKAPAEEQAG
jgi:hypothetical protein